MKFPWQNRRPSHDIEFRLYGEIREAWLELLDSTGYREERLIALAILLLQRVQKNKIDKGRLILEDKESVQTVLEFL